MACQAYRTPLAQVCTSYFHRRPFNFLWSYFTSPLFKPSTLLETQHAPTNLPNVHVRLPTMSRLSNDLRLHPKPRRQRLLLCLVQPYAPRLPLHRLPKANMDIHTRSLARVSRRDGRVHRPRPDVPEPMERQCVQNPDRVPDSRAILRRC